MAFTKTAWNSGAAPGVSATQLNRQETGISDCHNPAYSNPLVTTDLVTHLPSTAEKGRLSITLDGRTIDDSGTIRSAKASVRSVGINILNPGLNTANTQITGSTGVTSAFSGRTLSGFVGVLPSTTYTRTTYYGTSPDDHRQIAYYDSSKNYLSGGIIASSGQFATPANCAFIRTSWGNVVFADDTVQVAKGALSNTAYTPYVETSYAPAVELRSLPNLVKDTLTGDGVLTRRVSEYVLQSADVTGMSALTNVDLALLSKTPLTGYLHSATADATGNTLYLGGYLPLNGVTVDSVGSIGRYYVNAGNWSVIVTKGTSVTDARTALAGKTVIYQLATPTTQSIGGSVLIAEPSGTIYLEPETGYLQPEVTYSYPTNPAATNQGNSDLARVLDAKKLDKPAVAGVEGQFLGLDADGNTVWASGDFNSGSFVETTTLAAGATYTKLVPIGAGFKLGIITLIKTGGNEGSRLITGLAATSATAQAHYVNGSGTTSAETVDRAVTDRFGSTATLYGSAPYSGATFVTLEHVYINGSNLEFAWKNWDTGDRTLAIRAKWEVLA